MRAGFHRPFVVSSLVAACLAAACAAKAPAPEATVTATPPTPPTAPTLAAAPAATPTAATTTASTEPAAAPRAQAAKPAPLPPPTELEQQHGLQIAQLALTASGGLVDVRFKVLDPVKVRTLLADPMRAPMLIAGDKPPLLAPHHALKGAKYAQGQVFYILYPNTRGVVQPGAEVTVAMGDVRLGPVKVQ